MGLEEALEALGRYGAWQVWTFVIVCIITHFPAMWQLYAIVFIGYPNSYHCIGTENVYFPNGTINQDILNISVPKETNTYGQVLTAKCEQYVNYSRYGDTKKEACTDWYIDPNDFDPDKGTMFMEWNLVCEKEVYIMISQIVFGCGVLLGFCLMSPFDDMFGRKTMLFYCLLLTNTFGVAMAFAPTYEWLCIFQFLTGFTASNLYLCGFVIACELYPTSIRSVTATSSYYFQSIGIALLPLWAHFLRNWRTLQFAFSVASFPFLLYYWWCPESLRWLLANGRVEETRKWLKKAEKFNNVTIPDHILTTKFDYGNQKKYIPDTDKPKEKITFIKYLSHGKLFMYTMLFFYLWNTTATMQFGIGYLNAVLAGNRYLNFALFGLVELVGVVISTFANQKWGRRYPLMAFHFAAFLFLGTAAILDYLKGSQDLDPIWTTVFTICGKLAAAASTASEAVYVQEIYPTEIRGTAVGMMFGIGFIGGIAAPVSIYLARATAVYVPIAAFAIFSLTATFAVIPLPETHFRDLPETIEEVLAWPRTQSKEEWQELRDIVRRRKQERKLALKKVLAGGMPDGDGGMAVSTENGPPTVTHPPSKMAFSNLGYTVYEGVVKL